MGMHLEKGVREGRLSIEEASTGKKYEGGFSKRKDGETNLVTVERRRKPYVKKSSRSQHHQMSSVIPNLVQPKIPPQMLEPMSWWYKPDQHCAYHQGALGHDIENCYPLKYEVQRLVRSGIVSFEDRAPNVKANLLPAHGNSNVNMVDGCPGEYKVYDVRYIRRSLVEVHKTLCQISECEHDHKGCIICSVNSHGCVIVKGDIQRLMDEVPYESDKVIPYKYDATMIKHGQEVPLPATTSVVRIVDVVKSSESNGLKSKDDNDEVLHLIKKSEFNFMEQLLQTPSKIFVLSLLMNSEAHREDLQKVLEQAYVEHDVTVDQFDHIVANITSCNNMSFFDEELPEEGRNHNLTLYISMNCKEDALSNVLVDTSSSLNVLPKSTLAKLSYKGAPMKYSGVIVKAFDGTVTSTLHQKLKFVKNEKLVIIGGDKEMLVSHLSYFMYAKVEEVVGTPFQALFVANMIQKTGASMFSLKYVQEIVQAGDTYN
ncbi:uncharacterized protein LOC127082217 [Lathyrus oleraceus]|uniref:uncharacterized protein LOC127082217 n=1 Tax=Pisum sativum TaxID=3888 RepID=UPI0021D2BA00|nr:uncharacterized protein LOC127082217 [Pisum sativum]